VFSSSGQRGSASVRFGGSVHGSGARARALVRCLGAPYVLGAVAGFGTRRFSSRGLGARGVVVICRFGHRRACDAVWWPRQGRCTKAIVGEEGESIAFGVNGVDYEGDLKGKHPAICANGSVRHRALRESDTARRQLSAITGGGRAGRRCSKRPRHTPAPTISRPGAGAAYAGVMVATATRRPASARAGRSSRPRPSAGPPPRTANADRRGR
jgi:hypothetical protein